MLTKNELKYYSNLLKKKYRKSEKKFIVEGKKLIDEAMGSNYRCEIICATNQFLESEPAECKKLGHSNRFEIIKYNELEKLCDTISPQGICGVFLTTPNQKDGDYKSTPVVMLDNINDPGNVGTIIRTCDWFGIEEIILSPNCADIYSPKVIRSSMGSLFHIPLIKYSELSKEILKYRQHKYKALIADLKGESVYKFKNEGKLLVIFSNEAHGPSDNVTGIADKAITIPGYGNAESLNVASAAAIILSCLSAGN
jgi:TrmH family RNA methyltransferase